jgi:hypothetical protein
MRRVAGAVLIPLALSMASCGSPAPAPSASTTLHATTASPSAGPAPALVGTWETSYDCGVMVRLLFRAGLADQAARWGAGNFVSGWKKATNRAEILALCRGVPPHEHAHTFWADGSFNSWDPDQNWQQEDEGQYRIIGPTFVIGKTTFTYRVLHGDALMMNPVIPADCSTNHCRQQAAWSVTVAYPGHVWRRVTSGGPP